MAEKHGQEISNHPRPDFRRDNWIDLNGEWEFDFDDGDVGERQGWYAGRILTSTILVPFCYQSELSGIGKTEIHPVVWYQKSVDIPSSFLESRVLLKFGAVDYYAKVWINGNLAGMHRGGNTSFEFDITGLLSAGLNHIVVKAEDPQDLSRPRGKQCWGEKPERCWYTATTGIWQSVWLESVGDIYLSGIKFIPDVDKCCVSLKGELNRESEGILKFVIRFHGEVCSDGETRWSGKQVGLMVPIQGNDPVEGLHYWTPETPNLYEVELRLYQLDCLTDKVNSYFGMRKISIHNGKVLLNNRPYYQKLVLDQGYWPDGLMTPPSEEAIKFDILMVKKYGFNGVRKHQKIEDPRYYYWADRLGVLVWEEMPSAYEFRDSEIVNVTTEWMEAVRRDYNHPSIIIWVTLNESWGVRNIFDDTDQQQFAKALYFLTKSLDRTRLVSSNDGWEQLQESDLCSVHDYESDGKRIQKQYQNIEELSRGAIQGRMLYCSKQDYHGQPLLLTEYGGISYNPDNEKGWGYQESAKNAKELLSKYRELTEAILGEENIQGFCYTQLYDVMQETNGLMTFQRITKVDAKEIYRINIQNCSDK